MTIQKTTGGNLLRLTAGSIAKECCCGTTASACSGEDCAGSNNPSIQVRVFDSDYAGGDIDFCGKTWIPSEVVAGVSKCVCPTFHSISTGTARSSNYEYWRYDPSLRLERFINAGGAGANILRINVGGGVVTSYYWHYFTLGNTSSTNANTFNGGFPPQQAQSVITNATSQYQGFLQDGYFNVTYTSSGVEYSWARGNLWP